MQYFTRPQESPSSATLAMLQANPTVSVEVLPVEDRFGRTVAVRTIASDSFETDSVYVCNGDNPVFVANVIALAHAHNVWVATQRSRDWCDGI